MTTTPRLKNAAIALLASSSLLLTGCNTIEAGGQPLPQQPALLLGLLDRGAVIGFWCARPGVGESPAHRALDHRRVHRSRRAQLVLAGDLWRAVGSSRGVQGRRRRRSD